MLRLIAVTTLLAAPAMAQGLDCTVSYRCLEGEPCRASETVRIAIRPAEGEAYLFKLADGPAFTARHEVIGSVTRFTTEPVFDVFWTLATGPEGPAMASAASASRSLAMHHFVGRCQPA